MLAFHSEQRVYAYDMCMMYRFSHIYEEVFKLW